MIGGIIVQVIETEISIVVEVLNSHSLDRMWRSLPKGTDVEEGDQLWWQSHVGYLTRDGEFEDDDVGRCYHASPHGAIVDEDDCNGMAAH